MIVLKDLDNATCCFFGHRKIERTKELEEKLKSVLDSLIVNKGVNTFLFGSKSEFNTLCYEIVSELKLKHPNIKRVYVRAEYPYINENYKKYILEMYEDTYYPDSVLNAGKAVYIKRNCEMIDKSLFCVCYYDKNYIPSIKGTQSRNSGTRIAYEYALNKGICLVNVF